MGFEVLDISGDVGIKTQGSTCEEAFVNAGIAMYSLITDIEKIAERKEVAIEAASDSIDSLLVSYLNELIFQCDAYGFIGKRIDVLYFNADKPSIKVKVYGEEFDTDRHERRLLIKAATYHKLRVENIDGQWMIEVIFDI
ncbi:MAG: archease [Nitrospirae bacterium]|nr:archease [Nitrospirota bacterium]